MTLEEVEREQILEALEAMRGNKTQAALMLGISRITILNKMDRYGIPRAYGDPTFEKSSHSHVNERRR